MPLLILIFFAGFANAKPQVVSIPTPVEGTKIELLCNETEKITRTVQSVRNGRLTILIRDAKGEITADMWPWQQCSSTFLEINSPKMHTYGSLPKGPAANTHYILATSNTFLFLASDTNDFVNGAVGKKFKREVNTGKPVTVDGKKIETLEVLETFVGLDHPDPHDPPPPKQTYRCFMSKEYGVPVETEFKSGKDRKACKAVSIQLPTAAESSTTEATAAPAVTTSDPATTPASAATPVTAPTATPAKPKVAKPAAAPTPPPVGN